jgi:hypothetical protein
MARSMNDRVDPDKPPQTRFHELIAEIVKTHDTKNRDYADSQSDPLANFRECEDFGIPAYLGVLTRMSDKWKRIKNLARRRYMGRGGPAVADESMLDTLRDLAVYSLICIELIEELDGNNDPA